MRIGAEERAAWADERLVGKVCEGDEVIVNTQARDLGLGSGGCDVVHVNLTRGLDAPGADRATAMKLNYTSLQHPVEPVEARMEGSAARRIPVLVLSLHGQLAPAAWATAARRVGDASRLRPDCGRRAAGSALGGRRRAPPARAALRASDRRARIRRRDGGAHRDRRAAGGGRAARAGMP